jgi:hypothetical protein
MSVSGVLYLRASEDLKNAVRDRAEAQGRTLSGAAVELMELGLRAAQDEESTRELEQRLEAARVEMERLREQASGERERAERAEQHSRLLERAVEAWQARARQPVGACGKCKRPVRGEDVLVSGTCPSCGHTVATQLAGAVGEGLDQKELLFVLGAAGLLLGLLAASGGSK